MFGGENGSFDSSLGVVSTQEFGKVFVIGIFPKNNKLALTTAAIFANVARLERAARTL